MYQVGDELFPSATTILGATERTDWLQDWIDRVGKERADYLTQYGAERGTYVHGMIHKYLSNQRIEKSDHRPDYFWTFHRVRSILDRIDEILLLEQPVYSEAYKIAGTLDCAARFDGTRSVIDFKNYRKPKTKEQLETAFIQAAIYAICFEEEVRQILGLEIQIEKLVVIFSAEETCSGVEVVNFQDFKEKALARIARYHAEFKV